MEEKTLDVTNMEQLKEKVGDVEVYGYPGAWHCLCKASSKIQGWMKSTKVMGVPGGVLVQVSTQQGSAVAEAVTFVPGVHIANTVEGGIALCAIPSEE